MQERFCIHGGPTRANSIGQKCDTADIRVKSGEVYRVMFDCGMEFIREEETGGMGPGADFSLLDDGKKIDAVVLTHSHVDHIGWLAALEAGGYLSSETSTVCAPQTGKVIPFALQDGLKQDHPYSIFDAINVMDRRVVIPEPGEYELLPGLKIFVQQAGHIPGAMSVVVPTSSGKKGLITGDWCFQDSPTTKGALLPSKNWPREWIPDEIWSSDLTYGSGSKKPLQGEVDRLIAQTKIALSQGKKVVIPAFGNGRGPNIAVWLAKAGIPIFLDGVIRHLYRIFQETRWSERDGRLPKIGGRNGIRVVESAEHREELINSSIPLVIITTGGMGDFGPIVRYMEEGLPRTDWMFDFTSWLAPGTKGDKLMQLAKKRAENSKEMTLTLVDKNGEKKKIPFRASVDRFSLSAHGDLDDFVLLAEDIVSCRGGRPLDRIILTHGTPETKAQAAIRLKHLAREIIHGERNTVISLE